MKHDLFELALWGAIIFWLVLSWAAWLVGVINRFVRRTICRVVGHKWRSTDFGGPDVCSCCKDWK